MSKKVIVGFSVSDFNSDLAKIKEHIDALSALGCVNVTTLTQVNEFEPIDPENCRTVVLHPNEESEMVFVTAIGKFDEIQNDLDVRDVMENGICVSMYSENPDCDKYGTPSFVADENSAASYALEEFGVANFCRDFSISSVDRGDSGESNFWFEMQIKKTPEQVEGAGEPSAEHPQEQGRVTKNVKLTFSLDVEMNSGSVVDDFTNELGYSILVGGSEFNVKQVELVEAGANSD